MKQIHQMISVVGACLASLTLTSIASASEIVFHPEAAVYAGNGCPLGSTSITVDEFGDLYIDHSILAILLPANGENQVLAARRTCISRIPAKVPRGFYVKSIEQRLIYGVAKSAGADLQLASRAAFSSDSIRPFIVSLPKGEEVYSENSMDSRIDNLNPAKQKAKYCNDTRAEEMIFQVQIALSGQRDSAMEDLVVASYGSHFGEGIEIKLGSCNAIEPEPDLVSDIAADVAQPN